MRRMRCWLVGALLAPSLVGLMTNASSAGIFCFGRDKKDCCQESLPPCPPECCKPKRHCCLLPPDAPEGEVGFAIPGVVRPGQAIQVSETAMRHAVREAAVRDLKKSAEAVGVGKSSDDRLDDLEKDMKQVKVLMEKLTVAVDRLADNQLKGPGQLSK